MVIIPWAERVAGTLRRGCFGGGSAPFVRRLLTRPIEDSLYKSNSTKETLKHGFLNENHQQGKGAYPQENEPGERYPKFKKNLTPLHGEEKGNPTNTDLPRTIILRSLGGRRIYVLRMALTKALVSLKMTYI